MAYQVAETHQVEGVARPPNQKRASRACDLCRKTRSKCEKSSPDADRCRVCILADTACTYNEPIHKRGPPKGYIQAVEQRWQQAESILGAIISSEDPRAQSLVSALRKDEIARTILERIYNGPYGPSGRLQQLSVTSKDDFFASILKSAGDGVPEPSRNKQSRVTREYVSSFEENLALDAPISHWQDRLISLMTDANSPTSAPHATRNSSGDPLTRKRRSDNPSSSVSSDPDWSTMLTMDESLDSSEGSSSGEASEALGQLSLNENDYIQFLGKSSGLHLLPRSGREDRRHEGGLWRMPLINTRSPGQVQIDTSSSEGATRVDMPSLAIQDRLIKLYFTYFHPYFPVIHKKRFLAEYLRNAAVGNEAMGPVAVSPLLLLCMFSIAVRFEGRNDSQSGGNVPNAGSEHANRARDDLGNILHHSRPTTCQALLILGYYAFGMGSAEEGWIFIGMAIRMAYDLGLHRNGDKWKRDGAYLLSAEDKQDRQQIWWSCCLADKYASSTLGRPCAIVEDEYDTRLPVVNETEDQELWSPPHPDWVDTYRPCPGMIYSTFQAAPSLSEIMGSIMSVVQSVHPEIASSSDAELAKLEARLEEWLSRLDDKLRFHLNSGGPPLPPPHVLLLHIQYWMAVLLLHRPFVPNWKLFRPVDRDTAPAGMRAFVLSQSAATHISAITTSLRSKFGLAGSPPTLPSYLFRICKVP